MTLEETTALVRDYYSCWKDGLATYDEPRLLRLLHPELRFEGPLAGRLDGVAPFLQGLVGFTRRLRSFRVVQATLAPGEAATLYDCELADPAGTRRLAEFLRVERGTIREVRLAFDTTAPRAVTAGAAAP